MEQLVAARAKSVADQETANYVVKVVAERFRNPDWGAISGLLGEFSDKYKREWASRVPHGSQAGQSLLSINNIKNKLAHEGHNSLPVTLGDVRGYLNSMRHALTILQDILKPSS